MLRARAREDALALPPSQRDEALREVRRLYGTDQTSSTIAGPSDPRLSRALWEERQRVKQHAAHEKAERATPVDSRIQDLMDLGRAAAADRALQRQEVLSDFPEARP